VEKKQLDFYKISSIVLYMGAVIFFGLGLYYPIMKTKILFGFQQDSSYLVGTISYFFREQEYFLGVLLLLFSFILPILKFILIGLSLMNWTTEIQQRLIHWLNSVNKWAMLDVFVVALVIVNIKTGNGLIKTQLEVGTTFFGIAIVCLMLCTQILAKQPKKIVIKTQNSDAN
jgi:paraquat-inducible protein A